MVRYLQAAACLLIATPCSLYLVKAHGDTDAWSYLDSTIPTPLSDMSIAVLLGREERQQPPCIVLTGGCDSPNGNEIIGAASGSCYNITAKAYIFTPTHDTSSDTWTGTFNPLPDMPRARYRHGSATLMDGELLCVLGGRDAMDGLIAEIDCYNRTSNVWSTPSSLPSDRMVSDMAVFAHPTNVGEMYMVGGYDGPYFATENVTLVKYSKSDDTEGGGSVTYADGPRLIGKRGDVDVAIVDGYVYVSGGFTHENDFAAPMNTVERLALSSLPGSITMAWSAVDTLNQERGDKQLVGLDGRVYAIGGETKVDVNGLPEAELLELGATHSEIVDTVEVLDPTNDVHGGLTEWRELSSMPTQIFRFAAIEWSVEEEGFIFVFGGQVGYDVDCKCFRTTDKVMVLDVDHALDHAELEMETDGATATVSIFISVALVSFMGILLCLAL